MSQEQIPTAPGTSPVPSRRKRKPSNGSDDGAMPPRGGRSNTDARPNQNEGGSRRNLQNGNAVKLNGSAGSVPVTEWDRLSPESRDEIEQFVAALKAFKQGDFNVRLEYQKDGILSRAGELLNDILGLNEHMASELIRVGKVVGREGRMYERA